jgi:hypothetical protein
MRNYIKKDPETKTCECGCGEVFDTTHSNRRFFSQACKQKVWRGNHPEINFNSLDRFEECKKVVMIAIQKKMKGSRKSADWKKGMMDAYEIIGKAEPYIGTRKE